MTAAAWVRVPPSCGDRLVFVGGGGEMRPDWDVHYRRADAWTGGRGSPSRPKWSIVQAFSSLGLGWWAGIDLGYRAWREPGWVGGMILGGFRSRRFAAWGGHRGPALCVHRSEGALAP